ncbi:sporulation histidine kinase inhibitor Sda [Virgibacillus natechei]
MSLELLSNTVLLEAFENAKQQRLDKDFIDLLKNELNNRNSLDLGRNVENY